MSRRRSLAMLALVAGALALFVAQAGSSAEAKPPTAGQKLEKVKHVVVIYEENHSFDNLYGGWEGVNGSRKRRPRPSRRRSIRPERRSPASCRST